MRYPAYYCRNYPYCNRNKTDSIIVILCLYASTKHMDFIEKGRRRFSIARVILANHAGFCFGVRRAVETAERSAPAMTLGPIIHNPQVVASLAELDSDVVVVLAALLELELSDLLYFDRSMSYGRPLGMSFTTMLAAFFFSSSQAV